MLRFSFFRNGSPAESIDLASAYLVGSDGVPLRAEIELRGGELICKKRAAGPAALAIVWPVGPSGRILLETTRLQEREQPYVLELELLRGRLMRISQKREEWGLAECEFLPAQIAAVESARDALIDALKTEDAAQAARTAQAGLEKSVAIGEELALSNAGVLLDRRRQMGGFTRRLLGCVVDSAHPNEAALKKLVGAVDFAVLPLPWRLIEPNEQEFNWKPIDVCVEWLVRNRLPIKACGLVCFAQSFIPDWLYIWEHDFDTVRDLIYEHIRRVVNRYGQYIQVWDVISGIHANNAFSFNFEQLMELTRMSAAIVKQVAPQSAAIIDLVAPWGEYYARNQRTIPPLLYADMVTQSGVNFDAFGLHVYFGLPADGLYVRDMLQVSSLLDRFGGLGKPLHITAAQVPSRNSGDPADAWKGGKSPAEGGVWREAWSEAQQARWLKCFYEVALSKPFVETVSWRDLSDQGSHYLPGGGLLRADLSPKPAFEQLLEIRAGITPAPPANAPKKQPAQR